MARQKRDQELMARLADELERHGNVCAACRIVGIAPRTAYRWREASEADPKDERFLIEDPLGEEEPETLAEVWRRSIDIAMDALEDSLYRMGSGILEPVIHQGQQMYEVDPLGKPVIDTVYEVDPLTGKSEVVFKVRPCYKTDRDGQPIPLMVLKRYERAAEILLKAHRARRFRERLDVAHSGEVRVAPLLAPARAASEAEFDAQFRPKQEKE